MSARDTARLPDLLAPRLWVTLTHLAEGMSEADIAGRLGTSHQTIKHYIRLVVRQLGVSTPVQAVLAYQAWERAQEVGTPAYLESAADLLEATGRVLLATSAGLRAVVHGEAAPVPVTDELGKLLATLLPRFDVEALQLLREQLLDDTEAGASQVTTTPQEEKRT